MTIKCDLARIACAILVCLALAGIASSQQARSGEQLAERFKQLDRNGDGKLTPTEFPMSSFKQVDKNNDGVLTLDEVKAYYGTARRQRAKQEEEECESCHS